MHLLIILSKWKTDLPFQDLISVDTQYVLVLFHI